MKLRALVKGRVQGVGFRFFVRAWAEELGLDGWVRNLEDGRVEVEANGLPAHLEQLERLLREGPPGARVDALTVNRSEGQANGSGFDVRPY